MAKPKGCVYPNCFKCPLPDCTYDGFYDPTSKADKQAEWRKNNPNKIKEINRKYRQSAKGIEARKRYANSEKRKEYMKVYSKKYSQTEQYKEYQRNYKAEHKDVNHNRKIQKDYYDRHKDDLEFKARRREASRKYREKKKKEKEMRDWREVKRVKYKQDAVFSNTERKTDLNKPSIQRVLSTKPYEIKGVVKRKKVANE